MKLRNKKTGEIRELPDGFFCGNNLKKICEEWEDYEAGYYKFTPALLDNRIVALIVDEKATREEAKKDVEKLKAWKRLKDKCNFRFTGIEVDEQGMLKGVKVAYDRKNVTFDEAEATFKDLDLLFGGEE